MVTFWNRIHLLFYILRYISWMFLIPKKNGKLKPVIDLRLLNHFVKYTYFKMEGLVCQDDFIISLNLNQAFNHITLARLIFHFRFFGSLFILMFIFWSYFKLIDFYKIMHSVIKLARKKEIWVVIYLDNILILATSKTLVLEYANYFITLFQDLGFTINKENLFWFLLK